MKSSSALSGLGGPSLGLLYELPLVALFRSGDADVQRPCSACAGSSDSLDRLLCDPSRSTSNNASAPSAASLDDDLAEFLPTACDVGAVAVFALITVLVGSKTW